ncbi:MAG: IS1380 family transposase, partial [Bacteroidales bacterium]|nr:IS1380 family transposase [Bacteroidales bacterium]
MKGLPYNYTDKAVSPWGDLRLIEETYRRSGLKRYLEDECQYLPTIGSNRGYCPVDLAEGFMVSTILGATRLAHSGTLRNDEVVQRIFGWGKGMASQSTFSRFFRKFDQERNDMLFPAINRFWFSQLQLEKMTIDLDSTVITRHGSQEGVVKGYNPKRHGRGSHHPLIAFVAEAKMVANAWMRTGDSHSSTDFTEFFDELQTIIPVEKIGLFRADSGFCNETIMDRLEHEGINYIMATRMTGPLVRRIFEHTKWFPVENGYWTGSFVYQAKGWSRPRRMVIVRKDTGTHPNTGGKLLFPEIEEFERYKYTAFATNVEFSDLLVWQLYNQRADCENRIRELKYDYGIEGFCMEDFYATEAAFRWTMVAHNLMSLFRLQALNHKHHPVLSTMRFQCIAIGSYLVKTGR